MFLFKSIAFFQRKISVVVVPIFPSNLCLRIPGLDFVFGLKIKKQSAIFEVHSRISQQVSSDFIFSATEQTQTCLKGPNSLVVTLF